MAPPEIDGRGQKKLEEESSNGVVSNVAGSDSDSDSDYDYGLYVGGRSMSRKLREEYIRQVDESEGFDINLDLTLGVTMMAPINPLQGSENTPRYTELSRMAIDDFNSQNNKRYEFVKNLTVTVSLAAGLWCRITFQARDADDATTDALKTFQTLAWWGINGGREIRFCRLKKSSVGKGGSLQLLVLESIYGDNVFILDRQNGLRSFQIHIHIEVPDELTVFVNLSSSGALGIPEDSSPECSHSFKVEHLPPIVLTCLLPKSYPSHLTPQKISSLCSMLDSIWKEQLGQEVIYQWVEWLHSSSLSHFQFDQKIKLVFLPRVILDIAEQFQELSHQRLISPHSRTMTRNSA